MAQPFATLLNASGMETILANAHLVKDLQQKAVYLAQGVLYPDVIESCPPPGSCRSFSGMEMEWKLHQIFQLGASRCERNDVDIET